MILQNHGLGESESRRCCIIKLSKVNALITFRNLQNLPSGYLFHLGPGTMEYLFMVMFSSWESVWVRTGAVFSSFSQFHHLEVRIEDPCRFPLTEPWICWFGNLGSNCWVRVLKIFEYIWIYKDIWRVDVNLKTGSFWETTEVIAILSPSLINCPGIENHPLHLHHSLYSWPHFPSSRHFWCLSSHRQDILLTPINAAGDLATKSWYSSNFRAIRELVQVGSCQQRNAGCWVKHTHMDVTDVKHC
jgi:hypothetical protein